MNQQNSSTMLRCAVQLSSGNRRSPNSSYHSRWFRSVSPIGRGAGHAVLRARRSISQPVAYRSDYYHHDKDAISVNESEQSKDGNTILPPPKKKSYKSQDAVIELYELEAAKPRSKIDQPFSIFDYISPSHFNKATARVLDHLQPHNIKPYGSTENAYIPKLMVSQMEPIRYPRVEPISESVVDTVAVEEKDRYRAQRRYSSSASVRSLSVKEVPGYQPSGTEAKLVHHRDVDYRAESARGRPMSEFPQFQMKVKSPRKSKALKEKVKKAEADVGIGRRRQDELKEGRKRQSVEPIVEPEPTRELYPNRYTSEDVRSVKSNSSFNVREYNTQQLVSHKPKYTFESEKLPWSKSDNMSMMSYLSYDREGPERKCNPVPWPSYSERMRELRTNPPEDTVSIIYPDNTSLSIKFDTQSMRSNYFSPCARSAKEIPLKRHFSNADCAVVEPKASATKVRSSSASLLKSSEAVRHVVRMSTKCPDKDEEPRQRMPAVKCVNIKVDPRCIPEKCVDKVRADAGIRVEPKKLPSFHVNNCPCVEPNVPSISPTLKRLNLRFDDPPRVNACPPAKKCPDRADDGIVFVPKKLPAYLPGVCECVPVPPMTDVNLPRLKAKAIEQARNVPKSCVPVLCPPRADAQLKVTAKALPTLPLSNCPCVEPEVPETNPAIRRLKMVFADPPRVCPKPPECHRADDNIAQELKKLQPLVAKDCPCVEPPPLEDVPLQRLERKVVKEPVRDMKKCTPPPCPPRADDNLQLAKKKLPTITPGECPCVEEPVPALPKIRRLHMQFPDPPRSCDKPSPCPPRADDLNPPKVKPLRPYQPGECACIEPKPLVDVPLARLTPKKVEQHRQVKPECVPKPCERADANLDVVEKELPTLPKNACPCVEPEVPDKNPGLRRLRMELADPPRYCQRPVPCIRADDHLIHNVKPLPVIKPSVCECVEPEPPVDVPLIRLQKKHVKEPVRDVKKCLPRPCPPRADDNLKPGPKVLPLVPTAKCPCVEPDVPTVNPKMQRLNMKLEDQPRKCKVPKPCGERADSKVPEQVKKLRAYVPGVCECIEQPPQIDVPLVRLQKKDIKQAKKVDKKCIPKVCPPRADKDLEVKRRSLPVLSANPCPCVEPYVPDKSPKLKRLKIDFCDPPRICPPKPKCERADDNLLVEQKLLDRYEPGFCECIEPPPMTDVPLIRLKKKCVDEVPVPDFCKEYPRADRGCWEYAPKNDSCKPKKKKQSGASYNSRRKFNTSCLSPKKSVESFVKPVPTVNLLDQLPANGFINVTKSLPIFAVPRSGGFSAPMLQFLEARRNFSSSTVRSGRSKKKKCKDVPKTCKLPLKCPKYTLKRCPPKARDYCKPIVKTVDCNKKPPPYPSFSEQMHKEFAPFTRVSEWKCNKREFGFEPKGAEPCKHLKKKFSTLAALSARDFSTIANQVRFKSSSDCKKKKWPKCPKFVYPECPPKVELENCKHVAVPYGKCKKQTAPYPAFSDCVTEDIEEKIAECPYDRNKLTMLQPHTSTSPEWREQVLEMPQPHQGLVDPRKEEECVRRKYCLKNTGLSQDCKTFGDNVEPLRQRKDLVKKDPSKKHFSTWFGNITTFSCDARGMSTIASARPMESMFAICDQATNERYHLPEADFWNKDASRHIYSRTISTHKIYKSMTNLIDYRQISTTVLVEPRTIAKLLGSTSAFNARTVDVKALSSRIPKPCKAEQRCNKLTLRDCPKTARKFCKPVAKEVHCVRTNTPYPAFSDCPNEDTVSVLSECPVVVEKIRHLQPSTPLVPNIQHINLPKNASMDTFAEENCIRRKLCLNNEGISQSCADFGRKVRVLRAKDFMKQEGEEKFVPKLKDFIVKQMVVKKTEEVVCPAKELRPVPIVVPKEPVKPEVVMVKVAESLDAKAAKVCEEEEEAKNEDEECEEVCEEPVECKEPPKAAQKLPELKCNPKPILVTKKDDGCKPPKSLGAKPKVTQKESVTAPKKLDDVECKKKPPLVCHVPESLWDKIVKYFQARPNCPTPAELKHQRLVAKAQKAADAAGMQLVETKAPKTGATKRCYSTSSTVSMDKRYYSRNPKNLEQMLKEAKKKEDDEFAKKFMMSIREGIQLLEERGILAATTDAQYHMLHQLEHMSDNDLMAMVMKKITTVEEIEGISLEPVCFQCSLEEPKPKKERFLRRKSSKVQIDKESFVEALETFCNQMDMIQYDQNGSRCIIDELNALLEDK